MFLWTLADLLVFKLHFTVIIGLACCVGLFLVIDIFFFNTTEQISKNIAMMRFLVGRSFVNYLGVSIIGSYAEEIMFRGYLYYFLTVVITINIVFIDVVVMIVVSFIFAFLHVAQGVKAFVISFLCSIVFLISVKISSTIWYAVMFHALFNIVELTCVIRIHEKRLVKNRE